jgi:integrase
MWNLKRGVAVSEGRKKRKKNPNGMGTIRPKNNRYEWQQMIDGEYRYATAKTPGELKRKIDEVADLPITDGKLAVDDWFTKWLKTYVEPLKKEATYKQYYHMYHSYIKPEIGNRKLRGIKPSDIQNIIAVMNKKGLSTWTMKHARKVANLGFKRAVKDKYISINPVQDIEVPLKQPKGKKVLTSEDLDTLFIYCKKAKIRWIWAFKFLLVTGLRRAEILSLTKKDIEYDNDRIVVRRSSEGDTKNTKEHYVPLSIKAKEYLVEQEKMLEREFNPILFNEELKKSELLFPSEEGMPLKPGSFTTRLKKISEVIGVHISPHMFRHTFVHRMRNKVTLKQLQEMLGHDESTTTLDIYGNMIVDNSTELAGIIDEAYSDFDMPIIKPRSKKSAKIITFPTAK